VLRPVVGVQRAHRPASCHGKPLPQDAGWRARH
jgi:hypothetical protein